MGLVRRLTAAKLHSPTTRRPEIRRFLELTRRATRRGYLNRLRILAGYDVRRDLHAIAAPALFIAADCDHLVPSVRQGQYMAERVPGASLRVLHGHGHICLIAPDVDLEDVLRHWHADRHPV
jgi:pimeloyl-ACP methyl ester carboxylesterase